MSDDRISRKDLEQTRSLEALDVAQRGTPFCATCGSPMVPVTRGDALWLECPSVASDAPTFGKLLRGALSPAHTRLAVIDAAA